MGVQVFSAAFNQVGTFSLTVTDTTDLSITGTQSGIEVMSSAGAGEFRLNGPPLDLAPPAERASALGKTNGPANRGPVAAPELVVLGQGSPESGGSPPLAIDTTRVQAFDQLFADVAFSGFLGESFGR
jgi:hypothetical protein